MRGTWRRLELELLAIFLAQSMLEELLQFSCNEAMGLVVDVVAIASLFRGEKSESSIVQLQHEATPLLSGLHGDDGYDVRSRKSVGRDIVVVHAEAVR